MDKAEIDITLGKLITLYDSSTDVDQPLYYSKIALLELSGWAEISMDTIIRNYCDSKLAKKENKATIYKKVEHNSSFLYKNFRELLISSIGIISTEIIESKTTSSKFCKMTTALSNLYKRRNDFAHTYIGFPITSTYDAPNTLVSYKDDIFNGLEEIENLLQTL